MGPEEDVGFWLRSRRGSGHDRPGKRRATPRPPRDLFLERLQLGGIGSRAGSWANKQSGAGAPVRSNQAQPWGPMGDQGIAQTGARNGRWVIEMGGRLGQVGRPQDRSMADQNSGPNARRIGALVNRTGPGANFVCPKAFKTML